MIETSVAAPAQRSGPAGGGTSTPRRVVVGALFGGTIGMVLVGGSVAVSGTLAGSPVFTGQALRYGLACVLLVAMARMSGRRVPRPVGREWFWLAAVTLTGLVVFNIALVRGSQHAEPAVLGVAVACVPLALALIGPLLEGTSPARRVIVAAAVVTVGAALVEGFGHADLIGLGWAGVVFLGEAGFTLCAVPVLGSLGAHGVSVHTTWMAAVAFGLLGVITEGPRAATRLSGGELAALAYLAVAVTAVAFVLWYGCVARLGAGRTGLLTGVAPVSAAATGVLLGGPLPGALVLVGVVVVAAGLAIGLTSRRRPRSAAHVGGVRVEHAVQRVPRDGAVHQVRDQITQQRDRSAPVGSGQPRGEGDAVADGHGEQAGEHRRHGPGRSG